MQLYVMYHMFFICTVLFCENGINGEALELMEEGQRDGRTIGWCEVSERLARLTCGERFDIDEPFCQTAAINRGRCLARLEDVGQV